MEEIEIIKEGISNSDFVDYKVGQLKSVVGKFLWLTEILILTIGIVEIYNGEGIVNAYIIPLILGVSFFVIYASKMNYVRLSKELLVIKNNVFITKNIVYKYTDIKEVVIERVGNSKKAKYGVTIITNDLKRSSYACSLFKRKTFFDLKTALIGHRINVIDNMDLTAEEFVPMIK